MERYTNADHLELKIDISSGSPPASLPNVKQSLTCQVFIEQYVTINPFVSYQTLNFTWDSFNKAILHFEAYFSFLFSDQIQTSKLRFSDCCEIHSFLYFHCISCCKWHPKCDIVEVTTFIVFTDRWLKIFSRFERTSLTLESHHSPSSCLIAFQRFNVTVQGSNVLAVESNLTKALSEGFYDLSGCRISGKMDLNGSLQQNIIVVNLLHFILYSVWLTDETHFMILSSPPRTPLWSHLWLYRTSKGNLFQSYLWCCVWTINICQRVSKRRALQQHVKIFWVQF